jgi:hypothetical protein
VVRESRSGPWGRILFSRAVAAQLFSTAFSFVWTPFGQHAGYLFELNAKGKFTDLYDFPGADTNNDGFDPQGFVMDQAGNFYGVMAGGGDIDCNIAESGCGTVFKLTP